MHHQVKMRSMASIPIEMCKCRQVKSSHAICQILTKWYMSGEGESGQAQYVHRLSACWAKPTTVTHAQQRCQICGLCVLWSQRPAGQYHNNHNIMVQDWRQLSNDIVPAVHLPIAFAPYTHMHVPRCTSPFLMRPCINGT